MTEAQGKLEINLSNAWDALDRCRQVWLEAIRERAEQSGVADIARLTGRAEVTLRRMLRNPDRADTDVLRDIASVLQIRAAS